MFDFVSVLAAFSKDVILEAWETEGRYVNGVWEETVGPVYTIEAVVLQNRLKALEMLPTGSASDVALGFHTYAELYFSDIKAGGVQPKQTYVRFDNMVYKVMSSGQFSGNVLSNLYTAVRYYANDSQSPVPEPPLPYAT